MPKFLKRKRLSARTPLTPALAKKNTENIELKGQNITKIIPPIEEKIHATDSDTIANMPAKLREVIHDPTPVLDEREHVKPTNLLNTNQEIKQHMQEQGLNVLTGRQILHNAKGHVTSGLGLLPGGGIMANAISSVYDPLADYAMRHETTHNIANTHMTNQGELTHQDKEENEKMLISLLQTAGLGLATGMLSTWAPAATFGKTIYDHVVNKVAGTGVTAGLIDIVKNLL